mgnify:CR=1 FL=1
MIKCWEKRTEAILPVFFRFRQVSFYIEIFEIFYTKCLQVRKIYLSLHSRLRKTSNTAEHGAVVQLVRMRACHARGRGFEPHPHRLKALHESEGLFRIWHIPKSRIGQAIEYAFALLPRLSRYVNDGRISIDNNPVERAIHPLALGRKNWLFCGNDASAYRAAIVYSLISTCKNAGIEPRAWMQDALKQIPYYLRDGRDLTELLPRAWASRNQL